MRTTRTSDATLRLRLTTKMKSVIETKARQRNVTISDVVRDALLSMLDVCPTCGRPHVGADTAAE